MKKLGDVIKAELEQLNFREAFRRANRIDELLSWSVALHLLPTARIATVHRRL